MEKAEGRTHCPKAVDRVLDVGFQAAQAHKRAVEHLKLNSGHLPGVAQVCVNPGQLCRSQTPVPMELKRYQSTQRCGQSWNSCDLICRPKCLNSTLILLWCSKPSTGLYSFCSTYIHFRAAVVMLFWLFPFCSVLISVSFYSMDWSKHVVYILNLPLIYPWNQWFHLLFKKTL